MSILDHMVEENLHRWNTGHLIEDLLLEKNKSKKS